MCRSLIRVSNAAFNHPSMSFREAERAIDAGDVYAVFASELRAVRDALADAPRVSANILQADARTLRGCVGGASTES